MKKWTSTTAVAAKEYVQSYFELAIGAADYEHLAEKQGRAEIAASDLYYYFLTDDHAFVGNENPRIVWVITPEDAKKESINAVDRLLSRLRAVTGQATWLNLSSFGREFSGCDDFSPVRQFCAQSVRCWSHLMTAPLWDEVATQVAKVKPDVYTPVHNVFMYTLRDSLACDYHRPYAPCAYVCRFGDGDVISLYTTAYLTFLRDVMGVSYSHKSNCILDYVVDIHKGCFAAWFFPGTILLMAPPDPASVRLTEGKEGKQLITAAIISAVQTEEVA